MPVRIGKYLSDKYCWGLTHNDFHRVYNNAFEHIDVQNSTDNTFPPVLKAYSAFMVYGSEAVTISANSSGNNVYPASTAATNFLPQAVFAPTDQSYTWASTNCSSTGGAGIYYMICTGGEDTSSTSKGRALVQYTTGITPAYSYEFGGLYGSTAGSTTYRILASFNSSAAGSAISNLTVYNKPFRYHITEKTTNHTVLNYERVIIAKSTCLITLNNSSSSEGDMVTIKNTSTGTITIYGAIDGSTSVNIAIQYNSYDFIAGSTSWYIV